jgi:hypothetical protein
MDDDPLQSVYSYVERAYVRLQAGDLLTRCLEENSILPVQQLVDGLVLAGPSSLQAMREILAEASQRKSQVQDDLHQLYKELEKSLRSYGVELKKGIDLPAVARILPSQVLGVLEDQSALSDESRPTCVQILEDGRDLADNLLIKLNLLAEIESYLQDWLWGIAYQSVRLRGPSSQLPGELLSQ